MAVTLVLVIMYVVTGHVISAQFCTTANSRPGECISLYDCTPLRSAFYSRPIPSSTISFLRRSQCGFDQATPLVCCSEDLDLGVNTPTTVKPSTRRPPTTRPSSHGQGGENLLPTGQECGQQSGGDRIYNGLITDIDEFPWMALLGYRSANGTEVFECGGVLINHRYVLTAAHCMVGAVNDKVGRLNLVRLGEYNTDSAEDCVSTNGGGQDCNEAPQDIAVEEQIAHPGFSDQNVNRKDDIALIRLSRDVEYSSFITPICLPQTPEVINVGDDLYVAGWGRTLTARHSAVKLKLKVPLFDKNNCITKYAAARARITNQQLCAGGEFAKDTCLGDSGGPLMRNTNAGWTSVGIVSFGNGCGRDGWPGIYTSVEEYLDWIKDNIRP